MVLWGMCMVHNILWFGEMYVSPMEHLTVEELNLFEASK